jgi:hypothetical protein
MALFTFFSEVETDFNRHTLHLAGGEKDVLLNVGERLVFHSNLVHCGGPARFQTATDVPMSATAAFLHSKLPKGFTWFKQQRRLFNVTLTDLSIHYVLEVSCGRVVNVTL